ACEAPSEPERVRDDGRGPSGPLRTERAGFEPATQLSPRTRFPVALLRPLGHLSEAVQGTRPPSRGAWRSAAASERDDACRHLALVVRSVEGLAAPVDVRAGVDVHPQRLHEAEPDQRLCELTGGGARAADHDESRLPVSQPPDRRPMVGGVALILIEGRQVADATPVDVDGLAGDRLAHALLDEGVRVDVPG